MSTLFFQPSKEPKWLVLHNNNIPIKFCISHSTTCKVLFSLANCWLNINAINHKMQHSNLIPYKEKKHLCYIYFFSCHFFSKALRRKKQHIISIFTHFQSWNYLYSQTLEVLTPWQDAVFPSLSWALSFGVTESPPPPWERGEVLPPPQERIPQGLPLHHYKSKEQSVNTQ